MGANGLMETHLLSVIMLVPLAGAILLLFLPGRLENAHRWVANLVGFAGFLVSLPLIGRFVIGTPGFQLREELTWIPSIGAKYSLGVDGLSFVLILLTTALGAIAILSSWSAIHTRVKEYYILLLLLQTGMLGVFMSLDFFLFYVFWEVMLVPMYFLIGVWGSDRRLYAAIKFFLYTLVGSVLMLLAILSIYFQHARLMAEGGAAAKELAAHWGPHALYTFSIPILLDTTKFLSPATQQWLFWGLFFAFAIKVPMFPFHTWLPDAHTEAPTAGSVILAGVLLKMGTYGFLRFSVPMLPDATKHYAWLMMVVSVIAIIYGALVCMMQKDMKRLIAYSSVSHLGFCTLGIFALTPMGIQGSILQQLNHGISTGALFLIVGVLYERRHTRMISEFGGLSTPMPNYATIYLIITLSSLGMPLLNGFIGEFLILRGTFEATGFGPGNPINGKLFAAWAVAGIVLGAAYLLWLYQRVMFGKVTNPANEKLPDLNLREYACLIPLVLAALWIGIYPAPVLKYLEEPANAIVQRVNPEYFNAHAGRAPAASPGAAQPAAGAGGEAEPAAAAR
ncbi:MAG TPA: NADH-quinone oxidoreductase subunit M [Candidatus Acidoferrales bacterium]|nr:NADH-quinone oxidoreductase subunit M [Candidatus Acidoferrales bacterium]